MDKGNLGGGRQKWIKKIPFMWIFAKNCFDYGVSDLWKNMFKLSFNILQQIIWKICTFKGV